ncbi:hypothetical protein ABZ470_21785 [Streptosporangium sp. NPDC020072]|uniref:hypothetical protein n=1 Tax=Streptosporangium sp. NPDC020072 TaxID=3154788 RepID=UPI0034257431
MERTMRTRLRAGDPAAFSELFGEHAQTIYRYAARAALYRATALIPGVRLVARSADAMNRQGIAVAFDADGERTEWIFDAGSWPSSAHATT